MSLRLFFFNFFCFVFIYLTNTVVGNTVITASAPHLSDQPTIDLSTSTRHDDSLLTKTNVVDD